MVSRRTDAKQESLSGLKLKKSKKGAEIERRESSHASQLNKAITPTAPEISHVIKADRPPLRKYIRKTGIPGQEKNVVEVIEQKPKELTLASLKDKFGLSDSKIGGILRDAEKLGKIRRIMNGSYVWSQD